MQFRLSCFRKLQKNSTLGKCLLNFKLSSSVEMRELQMIQETFRQNGELWNKVLTIPDGSISAFGTINLLYCRFSIEEQEDGEQWGNLLISSNGSITWEPLE
jgi:hypothetical protein